MAKKLAAATTIEAVINRRLATAQSLPPLYRHLRISSSRRAVLADRGANWHIDNLQTSVGPEGPLPQQVVDEISRIVREAQKEFDCIDW